MSHYVDFNACFFRGYFSANECSCGILTHAFFADTFQPMNAVVAFQIGLNDSARVIRGKFTFAGA